MVQPAFVDVLHNPIVRRVMFYSFGAWVCKAIYDGNVFSAYLYEMEDKKNFNVGLATGANGIMMVFAAPFIGWASDLYGRIPLLNKSAVLGYLCIFICFAAVWFNNFDYILVSSAMWGLFWSATNPSMDALIADSTEAGQRSKFMVLRTMLQQVASASGPLISILLFFYLGNEWDTNILKVIIFVGLLAFLGPMTMLFLFPRNPELDSAVITGSTREYYEALSSNSTRGVELKQLELIKSAFHMEEEGEAESDGELDFSMNHSAQSDKQGVSFNKMDINPKSNFSREQEKENVVPYLCRGILLVPAMVTCSDMITGLASGMTIKFFPIYMLDLLKLEPINVQFVYFLSPLMIAVVAPNVQALSSWPNGPGRIGMTILCKLTGVSLLFFMAYLTVIKAEANLILGVFLVRTALMNCTKPLTRSVLMDAVPQNQRGRWQSLESFNMATWAGSAMAGGALIDHFGYLGVFVATAVMQGIALIPLAFTIRYVPIEGTTPQARY